MKLFLLIFLISCNVGTFNNIPSTVPMTQIDTPSDTDAESSAATDPYKASTCEVKVGNGSGQLLINQESAQNKKVICIKAGTYTSLDITGITGVGGPVVIQNDGQVEVTDRIYLSNLKNVVVSGSGTGTIENGILVRDTNYRGTSLYGKFHTFTLQNISYRNVPDYVISWDRPKITYDGTPDTAFYNVKFLRLQSENSGSLLMLYPDREKLQDVILNLEVAYCKIKNSPSSGSVIVMNAAFNVNVHHNWFENVSTNINEHSGMIFLNGDGKVHHNYFNHVLGNSLRAWPLSLGKNLGQLDIYNNITIDTVKYGMIEIQPFADHLIQGKTSSTNIRIYHNTAGNLNHGKGLPTGPALWTAGLVDLYSTTGGAIDIQNNLLFNVNNPRDQTFFINGQGSWPSEKMTFKNNLYFSSAILAGLRDLASARLSSDSSAIKQGLMLPSVSDDFYGKVRPESRVDVGATEH